MIIDSKEILVRARKQKYAVGAFNTSDLEVTQAILDAAQMQNAPVIVATSESAIEYAGLKNIYDIAVNESNLRNMEIVLHLDHGKRWEMIKKSLEVGYKSVMYDGSDLDFKKNIENTRKIVKLAKKYGASVEAEIGALAGKEDYISSSENKTDPKQALEFVEKTKIDSLAIAFGNAHGIPDSDEKLDFVLLEEIAKTIDLPLVFHGASSTPKNDMKKAISLGMSKINIDTDIRLAFSVSIKDFQKNHPDEIDPRKILSSAKDAVKEVVINKIKLFESNNKG